MQANKIRSGWHAVLCALFLGGCGNDGHSSKQPDAAVPDASAMDSSPAADSATADAATEVSNTRPDFLVLDSLTKTRYNGTADDLLTGGLGTKGLQEPVAPGFVDPAAPTAAELRRNAIHANYRALQDTSSGGGFGRYFGPNIDAAGNDTGTEGLIAGWEYMAYADDGSGRQMVAMMVQLPDSFATSDPCIITAPASGSRGVYGAVGTSGDWGLKRGCAVVYSDNGKGTGFHNLQTDKGQGLRGERLDASDTAIHFAADITDAERVTFNTDTPNRFATKHAHSQQNPERNWGLFGLQSIELAFYLLNEHFHADPDGVEATPYRIRPDNTLVIAAGVSNGGAAAVYMTEQDAKGLIDGMVVSEPNVAPPTDQDFSIRQGNDTIGSTVHSKALTDYYTFLALYQPCASLGQLDAPLANLLDKTSNENRCLTLHENNFLSAADLPGQIEEAQQKLNGYGFNSEQNLLQPSHEVFQLQASIAINYANARGSFAVTDNLCGFSYGAVAEGGAPVPLADEADAALFATSNGIPPTGGVAIIYNDATGGPIEHVFGVSPSSNRADISFDGFACLREQFLTNSKIEAGIAAIRHTANLRGIPSIITTGRADAVIAINHTARPYYAGNLIIEGSNSQLRYYEVLNAHHLDAFNGLDGFSDKFIPIHAYFEQAMDLMWNHLRAGEPLPPSQVVRTVPRGSVGGQVPDLDRDIHLTPIKASPAVADQIVFDNQILVIPE